jgi:protein-L-isoaspartate(D-aspartate) O-methyltransferase
VRVGDGAEGAPDRAPFGGISVTATASGDPPQALLDQLAPGAALVCPVNRRGHELLMRFRDGTEEAFAAVRFVPLISE